MTSETPPGHVNRSGHPPADPRPDFSVVLPCYNEVDSLSELTERLLRVFGEMGGAAELIFIDDGSTDATFETLKKLKLAHPEVRALRFSRNFGHHFAITAGLDHSLGETVVIMDSDLQMPPEGIPTLVNKLREGYDVVFATWEHRHDPFFKQIFSRFFIWMINSMTNLPVPLNSSIFRAVNRKTVDALVQLREQSRFITGLFSWLGFRQTSVKIVIEPRKFGSPKYTFTRSLELAMRTIAAFTHFPLQLLFYCSFFTFVLSFALTLALLLKLVTWNFGAILNVLMYFQAINFFIFGLLGEYLGRVLYEAQRRPLYIVAEEI